MVVLHLRALDSSFTASCGESRHFSILGSSILDITSYGSSIAVISALSGAAVYSASNHGTDVSKPIHLNGLGMRQTHLPPVLREHSH